MNQRKKKKSEISRGNKLINAIFVSFWRQNHFKHQNLNGRPETAKNCWLRRRGTKKPDFLLMFIFWWANRRTPTSKRCRFDSQNVLAFDRMQLKMPILNRIESNRRWSRRCETLRHPRNVFESNKCLWRVCTCIWAVSRFVDWRATASSGRSFDFCHSRCERCRNRTGVDYADGRSVIAHFDEMEMEWGNLPDVSDAPWKPWFCNLTRFCGGCSSMWSAIVSCFQLFRSQRHNRKQTLVEQNHRRFFQLFSFSLNFFLFFF